MKIAILGAGRIAAIAAQTLSALEEFDRLAIAARDLSRAQEFAQKHGFRRAYGSYEEMLCDPDVELVYIATPHSHHYQHMIMCLQAGKHVLCEKSFTMNAAQAHEVVAYARERGLYLAEAMWTRYMPSRAIIDQVIAGGMVGKPHIMAANLSYPNVTHDRIARPELAGGALLDLGVYGLNFALMHFGDDIARIHSTAQMTDTGVDAMESITLHYRDGRMAVLTHSIYARSDRQGVIYCDKGYIVVKTINNPKTISVYDTADNLLAHYEVPPQITGYEYEFLEARRCILEGKTESDSTPLSHTLRIMELMDTLRAQWGLVYPQER